MVATTSVSLETADASFVATEVAEGRYASATDVVRAGLQLLQERDARLATLRDALLEGELSGPAEPFDVDGFIAGKRAGGDVAGK